MMQRQLAFQFLPGNLLVIFHTPHSLSTYVAKIQPLWSDVNVFITHVMLDVIKNNYYE